MAAKQRDIPFRAALFDLDGTLLDSMGVWGNVDREFFAGLGLEMPADYAKSLSGLSYRQSAEYTIARFGLTQPWEEIVALWTRMAQDEYRDRVGLKPGSREYLLFLKEHGVKLAVTTSLLPELYEPCLKRNGVYDMFDAFCSTRERSKEDGGIFLRAAAKLGVEPADCAVFEDVYEGILGAKRAGMKAYCVWEATAAHSHDRSAAIADAMLENILDMRRIHDLPGRCVIFTALCANPEKAYSPEPWDFVLCADAGYTLAQRVGVKPDLVLGDFDSAESPEGLKAIRYPVEKDDTDTMLCVRWALENGYRRILLVGGLGGRFGHSMANVQTLLFAAKRGADIALDDGDTRMTVLLGGSEVRLPRRHGILSVFSLGENCSGLTMRALKYPLEDGVIDNSFPIGCSNRFTGDEAYISLREGELLLVEEEELPR